VKKKAAFLFVVPVLALLFGCGAKKPEGKSVRIQASSEPHREILEFIKPDLEKEGVLLEIVATDDYNIPNRALSEGEIDANFFQHKPFLEEQIRRFGFALSGLSDVHFEPMGIYGSFDSLKKGGIVAVPSDPTNEGRALLLLREAGIVTLRSGVSSPTVLDIEENPYGCKFKEIDGAFLARALSDVAAAVIPTNYALLAGLRPEKDAFFMEDGSTLYVNVLTVQTKDLGKESLLLVKKHIESEKTRKYIEETYSGAIIPVQSSK